MSCTTSLDSTSPPRRDRFRIPPSILWPGIVVALLGMQLVMCTVAIALASGGGGPVVERDYHQRALNWDAHRAAQQKSDELNWRMVWSIEPEVDARGKRCLRIDVVDSQLEPVTDASVDALIFHHADAHRSQTVTLQEATPGCYVASIDANRPGVWELSIEILRGDDRFLAEEVKEIEFVSYR